MAIKMIKHLIAGTTQWRAMQCFQRLYIGNHADIRWQ
jgi:hypothetical protein